MIVIDIAPILTVDNSRTNLPDNGFQWSNNVRQAKRIHPLIGKPQKSIVHHIQHLHRRVGVGKLRLAVGTVFGRASLRRDHNRDGIPGIAMQRDGSAAAQDFVIGMGRDDKDRSVTHGPRPFLSSRNCSRNCPLKWCHRRLQFPG